MSISLYELAGNYQRLFEMGLDEEVEAQAVIDTMESLEGEISDKLEKCCRLIRSWQAQEDGLKSEIERLQKRKKTVVNSIDNLKAYMHQNLTAIGAKKMDAGHFKLSLQQNPESLVIDDEAKIPVDFIEMVPVIQKGQIKDAMQVGRTVAGCRLVRGEHLRIR